MSASSCSISFSKSSCSLSRLSANFRAFSASAHASDCLVSRRLSATFFLSSLRSIAKSCVLRGLPSRRALTNASRSDRSDASLGSPVSTTGSKRFDGGLKLLDLKLLRGIRILIMVVVVNIIAIGGGGLRLAVVAAASRRARLSFSLRSAANCRLRSSVRRAASA